jgi:hypothetical protein
MNFNNKLSIHENLNIKKNFKIDYSYKQNILKVIFIINILIINVIEI